MGDEGGVRHRLIIRLSGETDNFLPEIGQEVLDLSRKSIAEPRPTRHKWGTDPLAAPLKEAQVGDIRPL